jgi:hypothetical protein
VLNFFKGFVVFFLAFSGVCSVFAEEKDWTFWQERFLQSFSAQSPGPPETTPHIKEVHVTATLPDYPWVKVSGYRNRPVERCITCHDGIASPSHPPEFGCSVCHGGEPESVDKDQAHATLIYDPAAGTGKRNPSSLSVVERSCGQLYCHAGHTDEDRNHVNRVKKSMMNTMAGVISGLRYQWAGQSRKTARYGTHTISDMDETIPKDQGALEKLERLPFLSSSTIPESILNQETTVAVSKHPADRLLRKKCFQCHIDSPPAKGQYRSQGCASCHFEYSASGLYEGNDPTISRTEPGHARFHRIRTIPSRATCVQCHQAFTMQTLGTEPYEELNIEVEEDPLLDQEAIDESTDQVEMPSNLDDSEVTSHSTDEVEEPSAVDTSETIEDAGVKKPVVDAVEDSLFAGRGKAIKDVHTAKGMDCTDCHTQMDIMGDGNLYSKQHEAVEIRCETCHGNSLAYPSITQITDPGDPAIRVSKHYKNNANKVEDWMAVSTRNRKMTNVKVQDGRMVTIGKQTGTIHEIPLVKDYLNAHSIPQHQSRLECSACHARWVVRCPGCHQNIGQDQTPESHSMDIGEPALMIGPRGKVAPMLTQPERHLTVLDERKNPIPVLGKMGNVQGQYRKWAFTNPHGTSGSNLAYALNPHSIQKKARSCTSCHLSPETLGLGAGDLKIGKSFKGKNDFVDPLDRTDIMLKASQFDPQAKVSMRGEPLAGTHQPKARTFNQKEIIRILRVGNCIPCHDRYDDSIYQDINQSYAFARTMDHRRLREQILNLRQPTE